MLTMKYERKDFFGNRQYTEDSKDDYSREDVKKARLVANPGCYTTCSILTAYPLVREGLIDTDTLIIDAKAGHREPGAAPRCRTFTVR